MTPDLRSAWVGMARSARRVAGRRGVDLSRHEADTRRRVWLKSLLAIYDVQGLVALDVPWWTFEAADEVDRFLADRPDARVFEWGAGASSVWLGSRAASVTTVEHDPVWAATVKPLLPGNVRLIVERPAPVEPGRPAVTSAKRGFAGLDFGRYASAIGRESGTYDLIVVDGRAREQCLENALGHLAPTGLLVLDNVDRARYREALRPLAESFTVTVTRGLTPALPYPTRTALLRPGR